MAVGIDMQGKRALYNMTTANAIHAYVQECRIPMQLYHPERYAS